MKVVDFEHQALARLIDNAARATHEPDGCDLCAGLNLRRQLNGLADQIRAAVEKVNGTPHEHGPKGPPQRETRDPPPEDPPPTKPGEGT